jgi:ECF transporter S component (folate family)
MGLLIALDVIAATYLTVKTPIVKIGLSFIPVSFTGIIFGPVLGGIGAAMSDLIQYILFPSGAFIPGLTLSSGLSGAVYGIFLYRRKPSVLRCLIAVSINKVVFSIFLNTFFLYLTMPGKTYTALLLVRLPQNLILIPIQTVVVYAVWKIAYQTKMLRSLGVNENIAKTHNKQ